LTGKNFSDRHGFLAVCLMENVNINQEIILEMTRLLDKTAVESFAPLVTDTAADMQDPESILIGLKAINAGYDKNEAITQVKGLMEKYNIQIDELLEQIKY
jgi:hypothetical protein